LYECRFSGNKPPISINQCPALNGPAIHIFLMKIQNISRRSFLKKSALTAVLVSASARATLRSLLAAEDYGGNKIPIGLQLYTIGGEIRNKGVESSLAAVAKLGYKGVEFAGYFNLEAKALRKLLDDQGLKCCGSHIRLDAMQGDNFEKTVEFNKIIGNTRLIAPSLGANYTKDKKSLEDVADVFSAIAEKLKPSGLRTGFHCHPGEFKKIDGETVWDIFFSRASKDVIMQCDLGHMGTAGVDPVAYMKKYPGRASSVHVKPSSKGGRGGLVGGTEDDLRWPEIFKACETVGGTEWYVVEYDGGSMEKAEKTIETLRKWGKC
jgi:sugar phosphate isomerase/epimerase